MTDTWTNLTRTHGRKSVMSLNIDDATLDAETERQAAEIFPLIRSHLRGDERTALDFGCGYGRFVPHLARLTDDMRVAAYDPCGEMLDLIYWGAGVATNDWPTIASESYDLIFAAMVLGDPDLNLEKTAVSMASVLAPDGLLVVLDHMPNTEPTGRWWRFRPDHTYIDLFARHGVILQKIGAARQLDNPVTILAGRRP